MRSREVEEVVECHFHGRWVGVVCIEDDGVFLGVDYLASSELWCVVFDGCFEFCCRHSEVGSYGKCCSDVGCVVVAYELCFYGCLLPVDAAERRGCVRGGLGRVGDSVCSLRESAEERVGSVVEDGSVGAAEVVVESGFCFYDVGVGFEAFEVCFLDVGYDAVLRLYDVGELLDFSGVVCSCFYDCDLCVCLQLEQCEWYSDVVVEVALCCHDVECGTEYGAEEFFGCSFAVGSGDLDDGCGERLSVEACQLL